MKKTIFTLLAAAMLLLLAACNNPDRRMVGWHEVTSLIGIEAADIPQICPDWGNRPLPELPIIDGSSSAILMHAAIRAFLTGEHTIYSHSQTYTAIERLIPGSDNPADVILAVRFYDETLEDIQTRGADLVVTPIAKEGFVFILHQRNPVDSLTVEQLRGIYSGEITNWNQVGGLDEEIVAYTRNWDSGSQTAMEAFMGDLPIVGQEDITVMTSMGRMLFGVQEARSAGIGYNIFSWSMLQDLEEMGLKTVAVNGVRPSNEALSDSSYPLMVYTYSYHNRGNEKAEILTEWLLTEHGQRVIASAGYVGINGQLPPDVEINFNRDFELARNAAVEYYHNLPNSRQASIRGVPVLQPRRYDVYVTFETDREYRLNSIYNFTDRLSDLTDKNLTLELANGNQSDVTVVLFVHFTHLPPSGGVVDVTRFIVLTREAGGAFEVINEGIATDNMLR